MNNLKRIFSLALATVMVLGMMVVGASATSFPDDATIENKAAVETMAALNIIGGREDGKFHPTDTVTRAEMAKMIAFALNGGKDINYGLKNNNSFTDVEPTDWFAEYVEYCASLGIVGGRGDGSFDPYANVTGQEAAKMVLVALGYDAGIFGFSGANWAANVDAYASTLTQGTVTVDSNGRPTDASTHTSLSLYDNVAGQRVLPLTRDDAAQLIYNGLNANTVTSTVTGIQNGAPVYSYNMYDKSLLESKFKATVVTVGLDSSAYVAKTGTYKYNITDSRTGTNKLPATIESTQDVTAAFKQSIRLVYQGSGSSLKILAISTVGTAGDTNVIGDADFKKATDGTVTLDGKEWTSSTSVYNFNNDTNVIGTVYDATGTTPTFKNVNGWDTYSLILGSDGKIAAVVIYPTVFETVTDVKNGKVTTTTTYTIADEKPENVTAATEDELAKGDFVLVSKPANLLSKLTKVDVTEDVVPTEKATNGVYTIGNDKYLSNDGDLTLGEAYDIVAVNGYILKATAHNPNAATNVSVSNVVYVVAVGDPTQPVDPVTGHEDPNADYVQKARIIMANGDGKPVDVEVVKIGADKVDDSHEAAEDTLYTYSVTDGKYTLTPLKIDTATDGSKTWGNYGENKNGSAAWNLALGRVTATGVSIRFNSDAAIFVKLTNGTVKLVSGAEVNTWESAKTLATDTTKLYTTTTDGFKYAVMGVLTLDAATMPTAPGTTPDYGYVIAAGTQKYDATLGAYTEVTLWNGTESVALKSVNKDRPDDALAAAVAGNMVTYTLNADGTLKSITDVNEGVATVTAYNGTAIELDGNEYTITNDTKIFYVNSATGKLAGQASGSVTLTKKVGYVIDTTGKKIELLIVDVADDYNKVS